MTFSLFWLVTSVSAEVTLYTHPASCFDANGSNQLDILCSSTLVVRECVSRCIV